MVFESLLLTCLITELNFSESGVRVALQKEPNETVLFFSIDEKSNKCSSFRSDLDIKTSEKLCDGIVFLAKDQRKIFCLVEMKGGDVPHATKQIVNTHCHLLSSLAKVTQGKPCHTQYKLITWKAYIALNASSPKRISDETRQQLTKTFGKGNFLIISKGDFGKFIRS